MSSILFCQTLTSVKYQECVVRVVTISKEALSVHVLKVTNWILMAENAVRKVFVKISFLFNLLQSTVICYFTDFCCNVCSCLDEIQKRFRESAFVAFCFASVDVLFLVQANMILIFPLDNWRSTAPHFLNLKTINYIALIAMKHLIVYYITLVLLNEFLFFKRALIFTVRSTPFAHLQQPPKHSSNKDRWFGI